MTDTTTEQEQPQSRSVTKRELAESGLGALDKAAAAKINVSPVAGGVSFANAMEVMEFAKLMAVSQQAVPGHLRNNPGFCLAITFQAVEWRMSPFSVANKSYVVNDRIAYESQLVHAVIEARAPLQRRLSCDYIGEGPDRQCIVVGQFLDGSEREYKSPKLKDIRVKNSPLWVADPDQQLWYYSSRAWSRKWCPDVLLGIYTKEELVEHPEQFIDETGQLPGGAGLAARLAGSAAAKSEGFTSDHVTRELSSVAPNGRTMESVEIVDEPPTGGQSADDEAKKTEQPKADAKTEPAPKTAKAKTSKTKAKGEPAKVKAADEPKGKGPKTWQEYVEHARSYITSTKEESDVHARWEDERDLRDRLEVPMSERRHLVALISETFPHRG